MMICSYIQEHIKDKIWEKLAEPSKPGSGRRLTKPQFTTYLLRIKRRGRRQHESRNNMEQVDKAAAEDDEKYIL